MECLLAELVRMEDLAEAEDEESDGTCKRNGTHETHYATCKYL